MVTEARRAPAPGTTEQRLVHAAERLFAERGVEAVSLRAVMQEAGTNVAAIHYHFGSKAGLVEAVLRSRLDQVSEVRNAVLTDPPGTEIGPRGLARAFVWPFVAVLESGGEHWIRLVGRLLASGGDEFDSLSQAFFQRNPEFLGLLERLSPGIAGRTLHFRLSQAMNITLTVLGDVQHVRQMQGPDRWSVDEIVDELIDVVASVLAGPPERALPRSLQH